MQNSLIETIKSICPSFFVTFIRMLIHRIKELLFLRRFKTAISQIHHKHQQAISKHYTSVFEPMDSWGWNKMAPLDVLYKGYIDSNDTVTLMISLRPESYMVYAQQTKREYEILRNKYKKLKNSDDTEKKIERYPTDE